MKDWRGRLNVPEPKVISIVAPPSCSRVPSNVAPSGWPAVLRDVQAKPRVHKIKSRVVRSNREFPFLTTFATAKGKVTEQQRDLAAERSFYFSGGLRFNGFEPSKLTKGRPIKMQDISDTEKRDQMTRRRLMRQVAGGAASAVLPIFGQNPPPENHHSGAPITKEAAREHNYQYFGPEQLTTLDALCETIIPADEHSPGAAEARVSEYIDAVVTDAPETTKRLWNDGLMMVNTSAQKKFARQYAECSGAQQSEILQEMAGEEDNKDIPEERFFLALKRATVDGYYTSRIGIHDDLQYIGNQALTAFPGCTHTEGL